MNANGAAFPSRDKKFGCSSFVTFPNMQLARIQLEAVASFSGALLLALITDGLHLLSFNYQGAPSVSGPSVLL